MLSDFKSPNFTDVSFISTMVMELVLAALAIAILHKRAYAIAKLYPEPSLSGALIGVILYVVCVVTSLIVMSPWAADFSEQPISKLVSNASASLEVIVPSAMVNGAFEEIFLLGFLMRGLRHYGSSTAIGASLLVRVLYHLYQGPMGAVSVLAVGSVLSLYYLRTERLFPVVFAHVLADVIPFL